MPKLTKRNPATVEYLRERLSIDETTGAMVWRRRENTHPSWNVRMEGKPAMCAKHCQGYLHGSLDNKNYLAHRVAFALYHGRWPEGDVDHVNGDKTDNSKPNLRDATPHENMKNQKRNVRNSTGFAGVTELPSGKFRAQLEGHRGCFDTPEEASAAYETAKSELGYSARHGAA